MSDPDYFLPYKVVPPSGELRGKIQFLKVRLRWWLSLRRRAYIWIFQNQKHHMWVYQDAPDWLRYLVRKWAGLSTIRSFPFPIGEQEVLRIFEKDKQGVWWCTTRRQPLRVIRAGDLAESELWTAVWVLGPEGNPSDLKYFLAPDLPAGAPREYHRTVTGRLRTGRPNVMDGNPPWPK